MTDNSDLIAQADELGIKIDKRWSETRLQQEIDDVLSGVKKEPAQKLFPVKLLRNYRPAGSFKVETAEGVRDPSVEELAKVRVGVVIHLPIEEARTIIDSKIAARNDPIA
jgi:hypothetical protein